MAWQIFMSPNLTWALSVVQYCFPFMYPTGTVSKSSGFQVTDEFMAQLPQQLIIPSSNLQLFESVGQGTVFSRYHKVGTLYIYVSRDCVDTQYMAIQKKISWLISCPVAWKSITRILNLKVTKWPECFLSSSASSSSNRLVQIAWLFHDFFFTAFYTEQCTSPSLFKQSHEAF